MNVAIRNTDVKEYSYIFGILLFCSSLPYFMWHTNIRYLVEFTLILFCLCKADKIISKSRYILFIFLEIIILYVSRESFITTKIALFATSLLFLINIQDKILFFNGFRNIYAIAIGISLMVYILVVWIDVPIPYTIIEPINTLKTSDYRAYPFLVIYDTTYGFIKFRFSGYFDEPGVVGTISAVILYGERYNIKKWYNVIILLAGLMSFSFFFIVVSLSFLILRANIKSFIYILLFLFILLGVYTLTKDDNLLKNLIYDRFLFSDDGQWGGVRSYADFEFEYSKMIRSFNVFCGMGNDAFLEIAGGSSSYKSLIFVHGIICFISIVSFFILNATLYTKRKRDLMLYVFILFAVIYQRPSVFEFTYFFLFTTLIHKIVQSEQYSLK